MLHRGGSLLRRVLPIAVGAALLAGCVGLGPAPPWRLPNDDIAARHNAVRAQNGLGGFAVDPGMNGWAQYHADRLLAASHGGCGNLFHSGELLSWYGTVAAENVLCSTGGCPVDGAGAVGAWMGSPLHASHILDPTFAWIGAGASCDGNVFMAVAHYRVP